jgi:hypothetical protein
MLDFTVFAICKLLRNPMLINTIQLADILACLWGIVPPIPGFVDEVKGIGTFDFGNEEGSFDFVDESRNWGDDAPKAGQDV